MNVKVKTNNNRPRCGSPLSPISPRRWPIGVVEGLDARKRRKTEPVAQPHGPFFGGPGETDVSLDNVMEVTDIKQPESTEILEPLPALRESHSPVPFARESRTQRPPLSRNAQDNRSKQGIDVSRDTVIVGNSSTSLYNGFSHMHSNNDDLMMNDNTAVHRLSTASEPAGWYGTKEDWNGFVAQPDEKGQTVNASVATLYDGTENNTEMTPKTPIDGSARFFSNRVLNRASYPPAATDLRARHWNWSVKDK